MRIKQASELPAAGDLLAYIREKFGDIPAFCVAKGLDRLKVQRAITTLKRVDVDFAFAIEEATDGVVKADRWRVLAQGGDSTDAGAENPEDDEEAPDSESKPNDKAAAS